MELLKRKETWNITYEHGALGETAAGSSQRFATMPKIYGRRCAKSGRVLVPPRAFSDQTPEPTTEWVVLGRPGRTDRNLHDRL